MNIISRNINSNFNKFAEFLYDSKANNHSGLNAKCILNNDNLFRENSLSSKTRFHTCN